MCVFPSNPDRMSVLAVALPAGCLSPGFQAGRDHLICRGRIVSQAMGARRHHSSPRRRVAQPGEMMPTEGGPANWLEKAKGPYDYMVRGDREHGYAAWLNVGHGPWRTPVEYGRRPIVD